MELSTLIERIGYIRIRANLSARKLSLMIGKNAGYIHMLEQNKNFAPTFETLTVSLKPVILQPKNFFTMTLKNTKKTAKLLNY